MSTEKDGNYSIIKPKEFDAITIYEKGYFDDHEFDCDTNPDDVYDTIKDLSEMFGVSEDYLYDILTPLFSKEQMEEIYGDKFVYSDKLEYIKLKCNSDGENMPEEEEIEESNEEFEELEKVNEELSSKVNKLETKLEEKDQLIQEYEDKINEYKDKELQSIIDDIVETRNKKGVYSDEKDKEEDKEELSKFSIDALKQVLKETKKMEKVRSEPQPPVSETEEDLEDYGKDEFKKMYKRMFGEKIGE